MQLRSDIQIPVMIKAMTEVVLPALDPANKLAGEQARLVIGTLHLMAATLPLQFRFDCDELARLLAFGAELERYARGAEATRAALVRLRDSLNAAQDVSARARAEPAEVVEAVRAIRAATGGVVQAVFDEEQAAPCRPKVQGAVLAMSAEQLRRDRAWTLLQGFEPDAKSLTPIAELIGPALKTASSAA